MSHPSAAHADQPVKTTSGSAHYPAIILAALLCALPVIGVISPRFLGFAPAALGLVFFIVERIRFGQWPVLNRLYLISALSITALAALSSFWAMDTAFALERSMKVGLVVFGGCTLAALLRITGLPSWFYKIFPVCLVLAGLYCLSELITRGFIYHAWRGTEIHEFNVSMINRAVMVFVLLLLPTLALVQFANLSDRLKKLLSILLLSVTAILMLYTDSQSAHLVVLVSAIFWLGYPLIKRLGWLGLSIPVIAGILVMPWLVQYLYNSMAAAVADMPWMAQAFAANRLEIWDFIARKALESPFYGFGIEATRHIEHFDTPLLYADHDHVLHPHNAVLQIWMEFGALGGVALCGFITFVLRAITQLPDQNAKMCLAVFMAVLGVSCTSYGLWQGWWIGLFTLIAALCVHVVSRCEQ